MPTVTERSIRQHGISSMNDQLKNGPVWIVSDNTPKYVILFADDFQRLRHEAFVQECLQSVEEYKNGQAQPTTVEELLSAFDE